MTFRPTTTHTELKQHITAAIQRQLDKDAENAVEEAVENFRAHARETIGRAVLDILDCYSVERMGQDLVIRVRMENEEPKQ
jgi:hypothetical protein